MSGMVLTPVSPTPDKTMERPGQAPDAERGADGFDEVSAREQSRLDRKDARQDRIDRRAEDDRVAEKEAQKKAQADDTARADKADAAQNTDKNEETAAATSEKTAEGQASDDADGKSGDKQGADKQDGDTQGDESLPMLFSVPTQINPEKTTATLSATGEATTSPTASATVNGLMLKASSSGKQNAGGESGTDGLLQGKADTIASMLGKGANSDAKTVDFSAQLARFQGGDSNTSSSNQANQNNAAQLQQRGLDSMATLKSYSTSVDLPVQHAEWGEKIAGKLAWLTSQRMSAAEIHVTPPDLGPLEVRVQVHHDQAQITVHATHAAVRDQLELNGHRLRDMLQENGLNLDRFEVSADASGQGAQQQLQDDDTAGGTGQGLADGGEGEILDDSVAGGSLDLSWRGEVDLYA